MKSDKYECGDLRAINSSTQTIPGEFIIFINSNSSPVSVCIFIHEVEMDRTHRQ